MCQILNDLLGVFRLASSGFTSEIKKQRTQKWDLPKGKEFYFCYLFLIFFLVSLEIEKLVVFQYSIHLKYIIT